MSPQPASEIQAIASPLMGEKTEIRLPVPTLGSIEIYLFTCFSDFKVEKNG
ncbi:MAG: hypothetical protein ACM37W_25275 [Actinomycetota bacterium]